MTNLHIMAYEVDLGFRSLEEFKEDCTSLLSPIQEKSKQNMLEYSLWITPYKEDSNFTAHPILGEHSEPFLMNHTSDLVSVVVDAADETMARNDGDDIIFYIGICFYNDDYPVILEDDDGIPLLISNLEQWEIISNELDEWEYGDTSDPPFAGYLAAHRNAPFPLY